MILKIGLSILFLFSLKANAQEPVVAPSDFIEKIEQKIDEDFQGCVISNSIGRAGNASLLLMYRIRIQSRFDKLNKLIEENPNMSEKLLIDNLDKLYDEILLENYKISQNLKGSDMIKKLSLIEMDRSLAESAAKLSIIASTGGSSEYIKENVSMFLAKSTVAIEKARHHFSQLDPQSRNILSPRLVARMSLTDLNIQELYNMRNPKISNNERFDSHRKVLDYYNNIPLDDNEKIWLRLAGMDAFKGMASRESGGTARKTVLDQSRIDIVMEDLEFLNQKKHFNLDEQLKERVFEAVLETPFYYANPTEMNFHKKHLFSKIDDSQPDSIESITAKKVLNDLLEDNVNTALGYDLMAEAKARDPHNSNLQKIESQMQDYGKSFDEGLKSYIGEDKYKTLSFLTYQDLMNSKGQLKPLQDQYLQSLSRMGASFSEIHLNSSEEAQEEFEKSIASVDIQWANIQCHKAHLNPELFKEEIISSPFGSFKINIKSCLNLSHGKYLFDDANRAANNMISSAIENNRDRELGKIGATFAADVAMTFASGGVTTLVKAGIQKTSLKIAAKASKYTVRHKIMGAAFTRGVGATSRFAADTLAVDLANQTTKATRHYIEEGLKGNWNSENFTKNLSYTNDEIRNDQHATRILVSGTVSKGLEAVWGRVPKIKFLNKPYMTHPKLEQFKASREKLKLWSLESSKAAANTATASQVVPAVDGLLGFEEYDFSKNVEKLMDGDFWATALVDSFRGNAGKVFTGGKVSSVSARYLSENFVSTISQLGLSEADVKQFEELEKCFTGEKSQIELESHVEEASDENKEPALEADKKGTHKSE